MPEGIHLNVVIEVLKYAQVDFEYNIWWDVVSITF